MMSLTCKSFGAGLAVALLVSAAPGDGRSQSVLPPELVRPQVPEREVDEPTSPLIEEPGEAPSEIGPGGPSFTLRGIEFSGASAFDQQALQAAASEFLGQEVAFADLRDITDRIEGLYRDAGYIAVRAIVPPQRITDGVVRVEIVEGVIREIAIRGELGRARPAVERLLEKLVDVQPVRDARVERQLLLARDLPGVSLLAALRARESETPGELVLLVDAVQDPYDGFASFSNLATEFAGPYVLTGGFGANSLLFSGDRAQAILLGALDPSEQVLGQLSYSAPTGVDGLGVNLTFSNSHSEPGGVIAPLNIDYESYFGQFELDYKLIRNRDRTVVVAAGFDAIHQEQDAVVPALAIDEDLRVLFGRARLVETNLGGGLLDGNAMLRVGVPILGASDDGDPDLTGDPEFVSFQADVSYRRALGERFTLSGELAGQISSGNLPSFEVFSLGNFTFGRGFEPGSAVGDDGFAGSLELAYRVEIPPMPVLSEPEVFSFVDAGRVYDDGDDAGLVSAGAGARAKLFEQVDAEAFVAAPVQSSSIVDDDGVVGLFRVIAYF